MPNKIPQIKIREIQTPEPPVIRPVQFPLPVINMPGCAAVHPDAGLNPSLLKDDPSRVGQACPDGSIPSFNTINFTPSELTILRPQGYTPQKQLDDRPASPKELLAVPKVQAQKEPAPKPQQSIPEQIVDGLPEISAVVTTTSIALLATTSALLAKPLADLLLKLIKPTVKKVVAKIRALRGQKPRRLSVRERCLAQRDRNRAVMALRRTLGR